MLELPTLLKDVMAPTNATFQERYRRKHVAKGSKDAPISLVRIKLRSQEGIGVH